MKRLAKLVDEKTKQMEMFYFDKYASLFLDAYAFLSRKKALLYGGTALNELLPTSLKIYTPYTLPDIDVLSPDAEKLAKEMVRMYRKKKHQAVSFTEALHPGTFKVYADGIQIADITRCDKRTYERLRSTRSKHHKIKIVLPQYIRMTLHKLISQPNDAHRWVNVADRIQRFYKAFPIRACRPKHLPDDADANDLLRRIYDALPAESVFFGPDEAGLMLGVSGGIDTPLHVLIDKDLDATANWLTEEFPGLTAALFPKDDLVPAHAVLSFRGKPIAVLHRLNSCVSFNEHKKRRIASIHTAIDLLLSASLSDQPHLRKMRSQLECLADALSHLQQTSTSKKRHMEQFPTQCHGPSVGVATLRRERARRIRTGEKKK